MRTKAQIMHPTLACVLRVAVSYALGVAVSYILGAALFPGALAQTASSTSPVAPNATSAPAKGTALVEFRNGLLHIKATDADLNSVLQQVARATGMKVQGATNGDKLYGDYGPAGPEEVLNHILVGLPYNFIMVQAPHSAVPQQLVITPRNSAPATAPANTSASPNQPAAASPPAEEPPPEPQEVAPEPPPDDQPPADQPPPDQPPPDQPPSTEVPQAQRSAPDVPPANVNETPGAARTPQQYLEDLRRLHQQSISPSPPQ